MKIGFVRVRVWPGFIVSGLLALVFAQAQSASAADIQASWSRASKLNDDVVFFEHPTLTKDGATYPIPMSALAWALWSPSGFCKLAVGESSNSGWYMDFSGARVPGPLLRIDWDGNFVGMETDFEETQVIGCDHATAFAAPAWPTEERADGKYVKAPFSFDNKTHLYQNSVTDFDLPVWLKLESDCESLTVQGICRDEDQLIFKP